MSRARLWPRSADRTSPVSAINCCRAKSIRSSGRGARTDCAKLRAPIFPWPVKVAKVTPITAIRASVARTRIRTIPRRRADAGAKVFESISSVLPDSSMCCRSSRGRACRGPNRAARGSAQLGAVGVVRVGQAEEVADEVEQGVATGGVFGGRGRAEGGGVGCGTATWPARSPLDPHGSGRSGWRRSGRARDAARPRCVRRVREPWRRPGGGAAGMPSRRPRRLRRSLAYSRAALGGSRARADDGTTKARPPAWAPDDHRQPG